MSVLISCEFGGQLVPSWLADSDRVRSRESQRQGATQDRERPNDSSRILPVPALPPRVSSDRSASDAACRIARSLHVPLIQNQYTHELIDVTRSAQHRQLFPPWTRAFSKDVKQRLIAEVHEPYRERLRSMIGQILLRNTYAIHFSIRTFDCKRRGKPRRADVGLLYDPSSQEEVDLCLDWIDAMYDDAPMLKVRRNYPRRGTTDCITKAMRKEFSHQNYVGIEVLLNRSWAGRAVRLRDEAIDAMSVALKRALRIDQADAA